MDYGHYKPDPKECFIKWLDQQTELIVLMVEKGYTKDQAIEMLKVFELGSIADNTGNIC